jgi:UDP-glucose 4-epimerase
MKLLVTGANGFVGRTLVRLAARDHEVLALDCLRYGPWRFAKDELGRFTRSEIDLRDRSRVFDVIASYKPDSVVHLAAIHFIPECERLPHEAVAINVEATVNLLSALSEGTRFVFASTGAVYAPSNDALDEVRSVIAPADVYGHTKLAGEHFVAYYAEKLGLDATTLRLFNVIGPGETNPHVLPDIVKQLKNDNRTLRLGNVWPRRDYIYVGDAADGFLTAASQPSGQTLTTLNLGAGKSYSVAEIVDRLAAIVGEPIIIEMDPNKVRSVDRPNLLASTKALKSALGFSANTSLDDALRETWDAPDMLSALYE